MASVIRVSSGDTIQVRTGVLQGIGPVGPTGPTGPQGVQGVQGVQGEQGPQGALGEYVTLAQNMGLQSIATATNTPVTFDTVAVDEYSAVISTTNIKPGLGNWYITAYVMFTKQTGNAVGARALRIITSAPAVTTVAGMTMAVIPTIPHEITIAAGLRITDPATIIQLQAYHTEGATLQLQNAKLWLCRTGSGPQGIQGIQGIQGPIGPAGPQGPAGPAGAGANKTTTFAQIAAG